VSYGITQCYLPPGRGRGAPQDYFQGRAIGGGRGQWLGRDHGECGARAYNGGLGAPSGVQGQSPWSGSQGGSASLKLKAFWSFDIQLSRH